MEKKYSESRAELIQFLKLNRKVENITNNDRVFVENSYFKMSFEGTCERVMTRKAVNILLIEGLKNLPVNIGFIVYDAFRSKKTQLSIFEFFVDKIKQNNPGITCEEAHNKARDFAAHPNETSTYLIPPHNSGGSIDLALMDMGTGKVLDFGTDFDDLTEAAHSAFFEQEWVDGCGFTNERWLTVRKNRKILFSVMSDLGFVNYKNEWWHFSIGDCLWASEVGSDWFYESMELEAKEVA